MINQYNYKYYINKYNKWVKFAHCRSLGRYTSLRAPYPCRYT